MAILRSSALRLPAAVALLALVLAARASATGPIPGGPRDLETTLRAAERDLSCGSTETALETLRDARRAFGDDPGLLSLLTLALAAGGRDEELAALAGTLAAAPGSTPAALERALAAALATDHPGDALELCRRLRAEDPGQPGYALIEASLLFGSGRLREAYRIYASVAERYPGLPEAQFCLGLMFNTLGSIESADRRFAQALRLADETLRDELAADVAAIKSPPTLSPPRTPARRTAPRPDPD